MGTLEDDLDLIVSVHNEVRTTLYPRQDRKAHLINENTVLRLQALLEAHALDAPKSPVSANATNGEIAARTLKYLRNLIIHRDHGMFKTRPDSPHWSAFERFARKHPAIRVADGQPICLDAEKVLQPLVDGLCRWAKQQGKL